MRQQGVYGQAAFETEIVEEKPCFCSVIKSESKNKLTNTQTLKTF